MVGLQKRDRYDSKSTALFEHIMKLINLQQKQTYEHKTPTFKSLRQQHLQRMRQHPHIMLTFVDRLRLLVQAHKSINTHLRASNTVFDGKHDIPIDLNKLPQQSQIGAALGNHLRPVGIRPGQELAGDKRHHAGDSRCALHGRVRGEVQQAQQLGHDFRARAVRHGLGDNVAHFVREQPVAPEDLHVVGLVEEVRLLGHHDAHEPVAVLEGDKGAGAGRVGAPFLQALEEARVVQGDGEGEPVGLLRARVEVGWVAHHGGVRGVGEGLPEGPRAVGGFDGAGWGGQRRGCPVVGAD